MEQHHDGMRLRSESPRQFFGEQLLVDGNKYLATCSMLFHQFLTNFLKSNQHVVDVDECVARLHKACGAVTNQIRVLAEMQTSIETAQAIIYQIGPQAHLRQIIAQIANRYSSVEEEAGIEAEYYDSLPKMTRDPRD